MKVLHVTPSFYPARQCVSSSFGLCSALAKIPGVQVRVLTTDCDEPRKGTRLSISDFPKRFSDDLEVFYCRYLWGNDISPSLLLRLWAMVSWADVVHLSAVYSAPTIPTLALCRLMSKPVVWSPRGALQRWQGSTRRKAKRIWESICNALCDPRKTLLHFTSDAEQQESSSRITNAKGIVIPNGIELPEPGSFIKSSANGELRVLYLGRLHPKKGIENLLTAMRDVKTKAVLSICGDGDVDYRNQLHALAAQLGLNGRVKFLGRLEGDAKEALFREADLCVVPSFTENFCVVVTEALAHSVPVIASRGTPWQHLAEKNCGLWIENTSDELSKAIDLAPALPLREMGRRGREWMAEEFSWQPIAEKMARQYRSLLQVDAETRTEARKSETVA